MKNGVKKLFVPGVYLVAVLAVIGCILLTITSINKYLSEEKNFTYSVDGIINGPVKSVNKEQNGNVTTDKETIIRPYKSDKVSIGRNFYDFKGEASNQENAIIFYENTYMQNSGVDYVSDEEFEVISVLDGKVLSVDYNEILGNIIKVEHSNDLITIYQGIDKSELKVGQEITQGSIIGMSGTSKINSKYPTSLHFEVYYKGTLIDPESFYTLNLEDLQ